MCFVSKKKYEELKAEFALLKVGFSMLQDMLKEPGILDVHPLWQAIDKNREALAAHIAESHTPPPEPPAPEIFNPKDYESIDDYPTMQGDYKVAYVKVEESDTPLYLWTPDKYNALNIYENDEWANNTLGRRIQCQGKVLQILRPDYATFGDAIDLHEEEPYPFKYDGGARGYRVMWEQKCDGRELWTLGVDLVIPMNCVAFAWVPDES